MGLCENLDSKREIIARRARQNSDPVCGVLRKIRKAVRAENTQKTSVTLMKIHVSIDSMHKQHFQGISS